MRRGGGGQSGSWAQKFDFWANSEGKDTPVDNFKKTWNFAHFVLIIIAQYWPIFSFGIDHLPWFLAAWKSIFFWNHCFPIVFFSFLMKFIFTIQVPERLNYCCSNLEAMCRLESVSNGSNLLRPKGVQSGSQSKNTIFGPALSTILTVSKGLKI